MGRHNRDTFWSTLHKNTREFTHYYNWVKNIAISSFEYDVPSSINIRVLEDTLATKGMACIFFDDRLGKNGSWIGLPFISHDGYNVYGDPVPAYAFGYNNYRCKINPKKSVVIYNNMTKTSEVDTLEMFAEGLYRKKRIIDINVNAQKTPVMFRGNARTRHTMLNLYRDYDGGEPYIFVDDDLNLGDKVETLYAQKNKDTFVADQINQLKMADMSEVLTYYGVTSDLDSKKERLIADEVDQNAGECNANVYSRLYMRQLAMDKLSKLSGIKCGVKFRSRSITQKEVMVQNEPIHDNDQGDM